MKSLTQYIKESMVQEAKDDLTKEQVEKFVKMQKDLGFNLNGTDLDHVVDVYCTFYDIDTICKVLNISTSNADTAFSKKQKIKTEFRKLA